MWKMNECVPLIDQNIRLRLVGLLKSSVLYQDNNSPQAMNGAGDAVQNVPPIRTTLS